MAYRRWIWCRDTTTGHHMDVDERQLARLVKAKAVEPVKDYPVNEGQDVRPRPAKPMRPITPAREPADSPSDPAGLSPEPDKTAARKPKTTAGRDTAAEGDDTK